MKLAALRRAVVVGLPEGGGGQRQRQTWAGGVWGDACPCSCWCMWVSESDRTYVFSPTTSVSVLWCRKFCGGTGKRVHSSASLRSPCHCPEASLLSLQFQSVDLPCPRRLVACLRPLLCSVSTCREFRSAWRAVLMTPSSMTAGGARRNFPSAFKITSLLK